jgi:hypothetical protein
MPKVSYSQKNFKNLKTKDSDILQCFKFMIYSSRKSIKILNTQNTRLSGTFM